MTAESIIFKGPWKNYPSRYRDLHYFITKKEGCRYTEDHFGGQVSPKYVRLNVKKIFAQVRPDEIPYMNVAGRPIKEALKQLGISHFITLEDRGWEYVDYWATIEAVYLSEDEYEKYILPRINEAARLVALQIPAAPAAQVTPST